MPFTGSHPFAVMPFVRLPLDTTALVIGSMAPDFEYFARAAPIATISHRPLGLILWVLPVTVVLCLVWRYLVLRPLLLVAPRAIACRATSLVAKPWPVKLAPGALAIVVISALLGGVTHLAWDAITHADSWINHHWRLMRSLVHVPVFGRMVVHRVIFYASSVVGLVGVAIIALVWLRRQPVAKLAPAPRAWPRVLAVLLVAGGVALGHAHRWATDLDSTLVAMISGLLAATLLASLALAPVARTFAPDRA